MKSKNICVSFAGPVGSSKSPIANYIGVRNRLPIFKNDDIRTEVLEDLGYFDEEVFKKRWQERLGSIFENEISFIYDASVDRHWQNSLEKISETNYKFFIISMDLSIDFLAKLYQAKNYTESLKRIDNLFEDHQIFLKNYKNIVNVSINDDNFEDRLKLCDQALAKWLEEIKSEN